VKSRLWLGGRASPWRTAWGRNFRQMIVEEKENLSFFMPLHWLLDGLFSCETLEKLHVEGLCHSRK
jgi:hypothetical protein